MAPLMVGQLSIPVQDDTRHLGRSCPKVSLVRPTGLMTNIQDLGGRKMR